MLGLKYFDKKRRYFLKLIPQYIIPIIVLMPYPLKMIKNKYLIKKDNNKTLWILDNKD